MKKNVLLSPPADYWHRLLPAEAGSSDPELHRSLNRGIQFLRLRSEPISRGTKRVTALLNDAVVGELALGDARHFHGEITRLRHRGMEVFLECKVTIVKNDRQIMYKYLNRGSLSRWADEQVAASKEAKALAAMQDSQQC